MMTLKISCRTLRWWGWPYLLFIYVVAVLVGSVFGSTIAHRVSARLASPLISVEAVDVAP